MGKLIIANNPLKWIQVDHNHDDKISYSLKNDSSIYCDVMECLN